MVRYSICLMLLTGSLTACTRSARENGQSAPPTNRRTEAIHLPSEWAKEIGSWSVKAGWVRIIDNNDPALWANDGWQAGVDPLATSISREECIALINEFLGDPQTRRTPTPSDKAQIGKLRAAICKIALDDGDYLVAYFVPQKTDANGWPRIEWERLVCDRARWESSLAKEFQGSDRYVRERVDAPGYWGGTSYYVLTITPVLLSIWQGFSPK